MMWLLKRKNKAASLKYCCLSLAIVHGMWYSYKQSNVGKSGSATRVNWVRGIRPALSELHISIRKGTLIIITIIINAVFTCHHFLASAYIHLKWNSETDWEPKEQIKHMFSFQQMTYFI